MVIYVFVLFMFHPLGWMGVVAVVVMLVVAIANQRSTKELTERTQWPNKHRRNHQRLRNVELLLAMGMLESMRAQWPPAKVIEAQATASNTGGHAGCYKDFAFVYSICRDWFGCVVGVAQEISPGMLIAGSILVGRALQPIEMAVNS